MPRDYKNIKNNKSEPKIKSVFIKSTKSNFKITCQSDLKIARKISK